MVFRLFAQVLQKIEDNAVDSLTRNTIYEKAARGLVKNLKDPYADIYSPEEYASFQRNTLRNNYGGLGMQIEPQEDQTVVVRGLPHTPAAGGGRACVRDLAYRGGADGVGRRGGPRGAGSSPGRGGSPPTDSPGRPRDD